MSHDYIFDVENVQIEWVERMQKFTVLVTSEDRTLFFWLTEAQMLKLAFDSCKATAPRT
jgi:hypothetical protein